MRFVCLLGGMCLAASAAFPADLLIRNVTVIDVKTGSELPKRSIRIRNGQISAVGANLAAAKQDKIINGLGRFAIPGLWDMHVHLWYRDPQFPLFLANGVTGLRDMGSDLAWVDQWRDQIKSGKRLGPHIETAGSPVGAEPPADSKLPVLVVHTPNEARDTFDRLSDLGVDFVDVLPATPRDAYFALLERARKWYTPVAGFVPASVSLKEAINARQKSVEYMSGVLLACSSQEEKLRGRAILALEKRDRAAYAEVEEQALATFDPQKASVLFARMALYQTREVPVLVALRRMDPDGADHLANDPRLRYIPAEIRKSWPDIHVQGSQVPEEERDFLAEEYKEYCRLLVEMRRAGVDIMAGTETGGPYSLPGYDLHRELELLVEAGLTPLDALRSATLEPARYLDADESLGSIETGKIADLVLLDADPLQDIRNTQKIHAVVLGGKYLTHSQLAAMLPKVLPKATAAGGARVQRRQETPRQRP